LRICYIPLSDAQEWDWKDNPKKHDTESIVNSIVRYGFKDPPKYEPELDAFGHGNGRTHALVKIQEHGLEPPRGVLTDEEGRWHIPVLFGVDSTSKKVAEAYAVDHNNLTMKGGDFDEEDLTLLWDAAMYEEILSRMESNEDRPITVSQETMDELRKSLEPTEEEPPEQFPGFDEDIETEHVCPKCGYEWSGSAN
jgi:hypothetical protein